MLKSLVVKSSSCQVANYSLMQKAEATKTKVYLHTAQAGLHSFFPLLNAQFLKFPTLLLVQLSKGHTQRKCL